MKWKTDHTAYLSSEGAYTFFRFQDRTISFLTGKNLDRYHKVKEWDHGYLVVTLNNRGEAPREDYLDIVPILENLMMNPEAFLHPIEKVEVRYDRDR